MKDRAESVRLLESAKPQSSQTRNFFERAAPQPPGEVVARLTEMGDNGPGVRNLQPGSNLLLRPSVDIKQRIQTNQSCNGEFVLPQVAKRDTIVVGRLVLYRNNCVKGNTRPVGPKYTGAEIHVQGGPGGLKDPHFSVGGRAPPLLA